MVMGTVIVGGGCRRRRCEQVRSWKTGRVRVQQQPSGRRELGRVLDDVDGE